MGTLIKKTKRHPVCQRSASISAPARIGAPSIGESGHRTEETHHLVELVVVTEHLLDHAETLGDHQCAEGPLQGAKGNEHSDVRRDRARRREDGEAARSDEEESAATEDVAESRADDEQDGEGQGVGGTEPLQGAGTAAETAVDRRPRDIHDRGVQEVHQVGEEHDAGDDPSEAIERWNLVGHDRWGGICTGGDVHGSTFFEKAKSMSDMSNIVRSEQSM